jgi:hypothetical protein
MSWDNETIPGGTIKPEPITEWPEGFPRNVLISECLSLLVQLRFLTPDSSRDFGMTGGRREEGRDKGLVLQSLITNFPNPRK